MFFVDKTVYLHDRNKVREDDVFVQKLILKCFVQNI